MGILSTFCNHGSTFCNIMNILGKNPAFEKIRFYPRIQIDLVNGSLLFGKLHIVIQRFDCASFAHLRIIRVSVISSRPYEIRQVIGLNSEGRQRSLKYLVTLLMS